MKKIMLVAMVAIFGLSLGLYGQSADQASDEAMNLQKKEQIQNKNRYEKGQSAAGEKNRIEQVNQGESSKIKKQDRKRSENKVRREAKVDAKQTMKTERTRSKAGR